MPSPSIRPSFNVFMVMMLSGLAFGGCQRGRVGGVADGPTAEELVAFYSPRRVKILAFTKVCSFDDDLIPDGINVMIQPLDGAGDEVKAFGRFNFELYQYKPASPDKRGEMIEHWDQTVLSPEDQAQFWSGYARAYEFQLSWEGRPIPPQKKYVLVASFEGGPGSERLFDDHEFEFRVSREDRINVMQPEKP